MEQNIILNHLEIEHKIKRIAYQIYETFIDEESIVIAGITKNGYIFAEKIAKSLSSISPIQVVLCEVFVNKLNPSESITTSISKEAYETRVLFL